MKSGDEMKKYIGLSLCLTILFVLIGCGKEQLDTRQYIIVEQLQQDQTTYEEVNKITNEIDVENVQKILSEASWGQSSIELAGNADYRLYYKFFDENIQAKAVIYHFWKDEVNSRFHIMRSEQYTYLSKEETSALLSIMNSIETLEQVQSSTNQTQVIDEREIIEQIESIIRNVNWRKAKVQMVRKEDYRMNIGSETIRLWITPNGKQIELVKNEYYSKLSEEDSQIIFEILEK
jgi:hypothetical protein